MSGSHLPCPHDGCPGLEMHDGKPDGCGHSTIDEGCPHAKDSRLWQATTITVSGCDDVTVVTMALDGEQFALAERIAAAVTEASTYSCMPTMRVERGAS